MLNAGFRISEMYIYKTLFAAFRSLEITKKNKSKREKYM